MAYTDTCTDTHVRMHARTHARTALKEIKKTGPFPSSRCPYDTQRQTNYIFTYKNSCTISMMPHAIRQRTHTRTPARVRAHTHPHRGLIIRNVAVMLTPDGSPLPTCQKGNQEENSPGWALNLLQCLA